MKAAEVSNERAMDTLSPYQGDWGDIQIRHLLSRTLFGVRKADIKALRTMTMEKAIDLLMTPAPSPAPPINDYNDEEVYDPYIAFGDTWVDEPQAEEGEIISARIVSLKSWWIDKMLEQGLSFHEKLNLFWHNHLCTLTWDVYYPKLAYRHFDLIRKNAFGNFKVLMREMTIDPQMLIFLNGAFNNKEAPDENFARELQELFCIGKGPDAGFTEEDVQAAARVLTGWGFDWEKGELRWRNWAHDDGDKTFSSFYNNKVIKGQSNEAGQNELDELMDMIFNHPEAARYVCRRMYRFFVFSEIDEATELNIIRPLADIFRDSGYEILPVFKTLFSSEHFYNASKIGAFIKSPADFVIGYWRTLGVKYPQGANISDRSNIRRSMLWNMSGQGQQLMDPPNVAGWPAYHQTPVFDKSWITTDSVPTRAIVTDSFVYWGFWSRNLLTNVDLIAFTKTLEQPEDLNKMIEEVSSLLFPLEISDIDRNRLKEIILTGQANDDYWKDAWFDHIGDPNNQMKLNTVISRLKPFYQFLFQLSEFHLS